MPLQTAERLALQHQRDLATIAGATTSVVASVAMGADPATISTWYFGVVDGLLARIQAGHAQARLSSTQFLQKHAAMNGVDLTPVPASLNMERARTSLRVTGPVAFQTAMRAGQDEEQAVRSMATQMAGSSQRLVMAGDRDTFEQTLNAGKGVIGWRRRLAGKSCGFCAMLASRGAVYETRKSATQAKDGLAFHDHCNCWAEPMYKHETEPPEVRLLQRQWRNVTAGKRGGGAARAWRQHWEENVSPVERERLGMAAAKAAPSPIPGPPVPTPGVVVRSALDSRKTLSGLEQAWTAEARRITGRGLDVVIPPGTSLQTAKEYAEGVLRGMERFPDSALLKIRFGQMPGDHYAEAGQRMIVFNERWSSIPNRPGLVAGEARMIEDWPSRNIGWGVRGNGTTMSTAIHEFGHIIDTDTLGERIHVRARAIVEREAAAEGIDVVDFVAREISVYATYDANELIAEAFADVMLRGQAASPAAREIFDLLEAEYFRAGGRITPSFGTFPSKAAPVRALTPAEFDARIKAATSGSEVDRKVPLDRNSDVVVKSAAARKALDSMGGTGFEEINGMLRGGRVSDAVRRRREAQVSTVDSLMEQSPISSDVELWRGSATGRGVFGDRLSGDLTGFEWTESGYVSTSWRRDTAELFAATSESAPGVLVRMLTPGGTHAVRLLGGEGELVLERGLRMRVVRDQGIVTITPREGVAIGRIDRPHQVRMLDVEVVSTAPVPVAAAEVPLAKMTVADLRALAKERGVTLPPKALKADIVRALEEGPSLPPKPPIVAPAPNLSKLKVADLRTMAAERKIPIPAKATKAELVRLVQSTPDEIKALQQKAIRDAARERNRLIESSTGTARLLAEVDELISKGASKATILQRLDPKLVKPDQVFAGADAEIVKALRTALETGDAAKLRTALTRAGTKAKVKPISKAGAKVKFDPATMESVGGEIADGAQVVVVTRGSTLTLPDGSTMQLTKAKVTAVARPVKATKAAVRTRPPATGTKALSVPPKNLAEMQGDPRAEALWHRVGNNGDRNPDGRPGFETMNNEMRSGSLSRDTRARVADIDSVMRDSPLPEPIEVYRGLFDVRRALGEPGSLTGVEFTDKAFVSTTTDRAHAKRLSSATEGAVVTIRVPRGISAIRMADAPGYNESEILLDRDLRFRVTGERFSTFDFQGETLTKDHEIDLEVIP